MVQDKSPFAAGFLSADLFYGGAWQPLGADLDQEGVSVAHGASSEGSSADVSTLNFKVTNAAGKYSPRNPASPLYGLVGRNTPARASVALGAPWLDLTAPGSRATTPDVTNLDITGDIDIRWWGARDSWNAAADLISKWSTTSNQRSWLLRAEADGTLCLFWSTNGTAVLEARSVVPVPDWAGRIALRVTMDVNDGAAGRVIAFEYADALSLAVAPDTASWTPLGDPIPQAGTTSIFNSTAAMTIGREPTSAASNTPQRVYGWSVRNGIGGAQVVRSEALASALPLGTGFTVTGETFTVTGGSVTNRHTLAVCEVAEWPMSWETKGAESVLTSVGAAGVRRRLGQGAEAVESVLYRAISAVSDSSVKAYWPMEDGTESTSFGPAIGSQPALRGSAVSPAAYDAFRGSAPLPTLGTGSIRGVVDQHPDTGELQVRWVQWTPAAGVAGDYALMRVEFTGGTISAIDLRINSSGQVGVFGYNQDNVEILGSTYVAGSVESSSRRFSLEINQAGSQVFWRRSSLQAGETIGDTYGQLFTGVNALGRVKQVRFNPGLRDFADFAVGHLTVGNQITQLFDGVEADILVGHIGEEAGTRLSRLVSEHTDSPITVRGRGTAALGEQQEETLLDLLAESAAADGGMLHDDAQNLGLRYRSLRSMGSQPAVTIPYTDNLVLPFQPTDDDALTRNRVTVARPNGSSFTAEITEGPMSTAPTTATPPGVGVYDESLTLNLHTDDLVERTAWWRAHVGTWDEGRYPVLGVDLAHPLLLADPVLTRDLLSLTPGGRLVITDPPLWLPPADVDVLVMGIRIEVTPMHVRLQWACVPARPYRVAYWNAGHRYSGAGTVTAGALTTSATAIPVTVPYGVTWTHADGNYDITIGGEVMTVTAVVGNTLTVTRSVNGVVKAHSAGAAVALDKPSFYSR